MSTNIFGSCTRKPEAAYFLSIRAFDPAYLNGGFFGVFMGVGNNTGTSIIIVLPVPTVTATPLLTVTFGITETIYELDLPATVTSNNKSSVTWASLSMKLNGDVVLSL